MTQIVSGREQSTSGNRMFGRLGRTNQLESGGSQFTLFAIVKSSHALQLLVVGKKGRIKHPQWQEQSLFQKVFERNSRDDFYNSPQRVDPGIAVRPFRSGFKIQRSLRADGNGLTQRQIPAEIQVSDAFRES